MKVRSVNQVSNAAKIPFRDMNWENIRPHLLDINLVQFLGYVSHLLLDPLQQTFAAFALVELALQVIGSACFSDQVVLESLHVAL